MPRPNQPNNVPFRSLLFGIRIAFAILCWFSVLATKADQPTSTVTFSEIYRDAIRNDPDFGPSVIPIVSSSFSASLYTNVVVSSFNTKAEWSIDFGDQIVVSGTFSNDVNYANGNTSATFPFVDPNTAQTAGFIFLNWDKGHFVMRVTTTTDLLDALDNYTGDTLPIVGQMDVTIAVGRFTNVSTVFFSGKNTHRIDRVTQLDLNTGNIFGKADFVGPTVTTLSPGTNYASLNSVITVKGVASDNVGVAAVMWRLAAPTDNSALGAARFDDWTSVDTLQQSDTAFTTRAAWSTAVDMSASGPGTNRFWVASQDVAGHFSHIEKRNFFYSVPSTLTLQSTDGGIARGGRGVADGATLIIQRHYFVTAIATNPSDVFLNWTDGDGTVVSVDRQYQFVMQDSQTLQANFGPNPFPTVSGTYNGLFFASNIVNESDSGLLTMNIRPNGSYTGKLFLETATHPFTGQLQFYANPDDPNAVDSIFEIPIKGSKSILGSLHMASDGDNALSRSISGSISIFHLALGRRTVTGLDVRYAPPTTAGIRTGLYNFQMPSTQGTTQAGPLGYGYGSVLLQSNGTAVTVVNIADQSPTLSCATALDESGNLPVFVAPYLGKGVVIGWLTFTNEATSDLRGDNVNWIKRRSHSAYFPDGFHRVFTITGCKYDAPKAGTNILGWTSGALNFADFAFSGAASIAFDPVLNRFSFPAGNPDNIRILLSPATGIFKGNLSNPALALRGVVLPKANAAYGFFLDQNQTGYVLVTNQ